MVREQYLEVKQAVARACEENGRKEEACTLIAVSKTKPVEMLKEAYDAGCRDFGENKVQELLDKYEKLPTDIRWHMIGHLQTNKVKYIVDKVALIHSVDSVKLAHEISRQAVKKNVTVPILLEVNIGKEESKSGFLAEQLPEILEQIGSFSHTNVRGLMAIPPICENSTKNRKFFSRNVQP